MSSRDDNSRISRPPRPLDRSQAAIYCAVSTFDRICPVPPIGLVRGNTRLQRFNFLDMTIDQFQAPWPVIRVQLSMSFFGTLVSVALDKNSGCSEGYSQSLLDHSVMSR